MERWVHKIGVNPEFERYRLYDIGSKIYTKDGCTTPAFLMVRYYRGARTDEFERGYDPCVYITLEDLLDEFTMIDSKVDNLIKDLTDFKKSKQEAELDDVLRPYTSVTMNEDEENREDIHTLHSEQSEDNETTTTE